MPRAELRRVQPARAPLPEPATLRALYRAMLRIRRVEEVIAERYRAGEMRCPVHLSIGQEAAAVGACAALLPEDRIVSTHRCHGHYLAKGGDLPAMIAELHGKATGCCGGRGGSMHLFDDAAGVVASVPIVGSSVPLGVGLALAFKQRGEARVAMTFLGDAAVEEGAFHEAANFAAVQGLPVVFFVENNLYSVYTRLDARQPARPLAKLGEAHGLETFVVYGNDVLAVREVTTQAVAAARAGRPALVVAETYRTREHCGPSDDDELGYRPVGELSQWLERCPLARMRDTLAEVASEADLDEVLDEARARAAIDTEIAAAFAAAAAAPFPAPETATAYVYAPVPPAPALPDAGARELSAEQAIAEATVQAMAADPAVIVMGEGVTDPKGIFGTTLGLAARFPGRVLEMPVAENGFTGAAIGAALQGLRPIVVHQRVEFALLAFEQLANNAAKMHYVSGGKHRVPLVVRLVVGRGWGQGPAHSQSLEALFAHIPGLKVVMPATPADCKGLLLGAIAEDNPVLFIEHRWVHYGRGLVPTEPVALPLDGPRRLRAGDAVTVVATSYMTLEALHAAEALARHGCMVDLIDLRVVAPLQLDLVFDSIARTGRLLTVDTGFATLGPGAEIAAQVSERCFHRLVAPPQRLGLPAHPTPSARTLAARYYPRSPQIAEAAARLCGLPERAVQAVRDELQAVRDALPVDVPHPAFRGPF